jgi:dethiobiotin synthetase
MGTDAGLRGPKTGTDTATRGPKMGADEAIRGLFVTGTDTGVGKTMLSASLLAAMTGAGEHVRAYKPVLTGLDEVSEHDNDASAWPRDHELLGAAAGMRPEDVAPLRYGPAVSPHLAAELLGQQISREQLRSPLLGADAARGYAQTLVVEGVGGLLVPLAEDYTVCDLAVELGLPLVIAARPGLGTINHTLLTLNVARSAGLDVCAVVLTPWPAEPGTLERSNRETIERMGEVEVQTLTRLASPALEELARAGDLLPWGRWLNP